MVCREENIGGANFKIVRRNLRMEAIAGRWQQYCTLRRAAWAKEYNRRVDVINARNAANYAITVKVDKWLQEVSLLYNELNALLKKFAEGGNVGPSDWDAIAAGKEHKVLAIVAPFHPRESWPRGVPYTNLIAKALYYKEEEHRRWKCAIMYNMVVQEIALRGAEIMELKRIAGDTTDGVTWETPKTAEQLQQLREQLRTEKQLQPGWADSDKAMYQAIAHMLDGEPVLSSDWDVDVWVTKILMDCDQPALETTKALVIGVVENLVKRWHLDNHNAFGVDDSTFVNSAKLLASLGVDDGSYLDDGSESESDDEMDVDVYLDTSVESEFFLPYDV